MHALVATGRVVDEVEHLLRRDGASPQLARVRRPATGTSTAGTAIVPVVVIAVDEHAIAAASTVSSAVSTEGALGEVEVDVGGLEEVVVDLVEVGDGADEVGADVALAVEGLDAAPDADVALEVEAGGVVVLLIRVDPLLGLDETRAVVELEGDVCWLRGDLADLGDEGYLCGRRKISKRK